MKLKSDFITHNSADESYLVPTSGAEFSGIVKGNKTLGTIVELLKVETTRDQVVAAMKERFEAPEGAIERDVDRVISELQKIGALEWENWYTDRNKTNGTVLGQSPFFMGTYADQQIWVCRKDSGSEFA